MTQPIAESVDPGINWQPVTVGGVNVQFGGLAGRFPSGVEANAVSGRHEGVIAGATKEERRCVPGDLYAT